MDYKTIGDQLKEKRIALNKSLEEVSKDILVDVSKIIALEEGDYSYFENLNFYDLFYKTYARYLDLLGGGNNRIEYLEYESESVDKINLPPIKTAKIFTLKIFYLPLLIIVVLTSGYMVYKAAQPLFQSEKEVVIIPPKGNETSEEKPVDIEEPDKPTEKKVVKVQIEVTKDRCWVQVLVDGGEKPVLSKILYAGEKYEFTGEKEVRLWIGNAGVLKIYVDGVLQPTLGLEGEVKKDIVYTPASR